MKKMLLATHGNFASGINSSLEIILGKQEYIYTIDAYIDDINFEDQLDSFLTNYDKTKDTLLVVTDLFGGSVNQKVVNKLQEDDNVHIIAGLNLSLLLELHLLSEEDCTKNNIKSIIETSKQQTQYVETIEHDDEDDFDF